MTSTAPGPASEPKPAGKASEGNLVFDYHTLRLYVGVLAFLLPWVVTYLAHVIPPSISGSYYTAARNFFVGSMCVIGILLIAYKGHKPVLAVRDVSWFWQWVGGALNGISQPWRGKMDFRVLGRKNEENLVSTLGGLGTIAAALSPTAEKFGEESLASTIHAIGGSLLFAAVAYFCLVAFVRAVNLKLRIPDGIFPFLSHMKSLQPANPKKVMRGSIYVVCGVIIALTLIGLVIAQKFAGMFTFTHNITYWAEFVAMFLFGLAWTVACQRLRWLNDPDEHP
jgi:hypothetical protein